MKTSKEIESMSWYVGSTGDHQGLIIDENGGANIAVAYDKNDAPLLAGAPALVKALEACLHYAETPGDFTEREAKEMMRDCAVALAMARGEY